MSDDLHTIGLLYLTANSLMGSVSIWGWWPSTHKCRFKTSRRFVSLVMYNYAVRWTSFAECCSINVLVTCVHKLIFSSLQQLFCCLNNNTQLAVISWLYRWTGSELVPVQHMLCFSRYITLLLQILSWYLLSVFVWSLPIPFRWHQSTINEQKRECEFNYNNTQLHTNIISWCSALLTSGNRRIISSSSQLCYVHLC